MYQKHKKSNDVVASWHSWCHWKMIFFCKKVTQKNCSMQWWILFMKVSPPTFVHCPTELIYIPDIYLLSYGGDHFAPAVGLAKKQAIDVHFFCQISVSYKCQWKGKKQGKNGQKSQKKLRGHVKKKNDIFWEFVPNGRTPPPTPPFWDILFTKKFLVFILHFRT